MKLELKLSHRPFTLLLALICSFIFPISEISANRPSHQERPQTNIRYNRKLKKESGKGGFAYRGMRKKYHIEDYLLASVEHEPQKSPWFESEKEFYSNLFKKQSYDVLVVPFQTQLDGVDPIGRTLMSYQLAVDIERRTNLKVAPLPLVHFTLGSHARFYDDSAVYALASKIGVSHIVWGFAGTREDDKGHVQGLDITVVYQPKDHFGSPAGSRSKSWKNIDCTLNRLPSIILETKLTEILSFIGLPETESTRKALNTQAERPSIPQTPQLLFAANPNDPISKSYYYQFMGMLISPRAEFHRQYMFIRSLIALMEADTDHPDYAILKARAYHHLFRRPAAVDALQNDESDRATLLRMMINGNLPDLDYIKSVLKPTMDGFFATVEYSWLFERY